MCIPYVFIELEFEGKGVRGGGWHFVGRPTNGNSNVNKYEARDDAASLYECFMWFSFTHYAVSGCGIWYGQCICKYILLFPRENSTSNVHTFISSLPAWWYTHKHDLIYNWWFLSFNDSDFPLQKVPTLHTAVHIEPQFKHGNRHKIDLILDVLLCNNRKKNHIKLPVTSPQSIGQ